MTVGEFLKTLAPDFMWVTYHDLLLMYEQIDEDCSDRSLAVTLCRLCKRGYFLRKRHVSRLGRHKAKTTLYMRVR